MRTNTTHVHVCMYVCMPTYHITMTACLPTAVKYHTQTERGMIHYPPKVNLAQPGHKNNIATAHHGWTYGLPIASRLLPLQGKTAHWEHDSPTEGIHHPPRSGREDDRMVLLDIGFEFSPSLTITLSPSRMHACTHTLFSFILLCIW